MRVAVIDDMPLIQKQIEHILLRNGYEVICFGRPGEAFWELKETPVDLMIVDLLMPQMNGYELRLCLENAWKEDERFKDDIPLSILCTGAAFDERINREEALLLNRAKKSEVFNAYLRKPIDEAKLIRAIGEATETRESRPDRNSQLTVAERLLITSTKQLIDKLKVICRPDLCNVFFEQTGTCFLATACEVCPATNQRVESVASQPAVATPLLAEGVAPAKETDTLQEFASAF